MVEVGLEDRVMAKMYARVVFKFMNKVVEVDFFISKAKASFTELEIGTRWL